MHTIKLCWRLLVSRVTTRASGSWTHRRNISVRSAHSGHSLRATNCCVFDFVVSSVVARCVIGMTREGGLCVPDMCNMLGKFYAWNLIVVSTEEIRTALWSLALNSIYY